MRSPLALVVKGLLIMAVVTLVAAGCSSGDVEVATTTPGADGESTVSEPDSPYGAVVVSGEALVQPPRDGGADPALGEVAPSLEGTGLDGQPIAIGADGRAKAVVFVAHWCPHCQDEVPVIADLLSQGEKPDELDLYLVSTAVFDDRENFPPSAWLNGVGLDAPIMVDSQQFDALVAYGGGGFPYTVYLDGENRVLKRTQGTASAETIKALWLATANA